MSMEKIIQISQVAAENGYTLICLTEDGKVYTRESQSQVKNKDPHSSVFFDPELISHRYWKEIPAVDIDEGYDHNQIN